MRQLIFGFSFGFLITPHVFATASSLLILGDSLSAGYNMKVEQSWPALLQKQWQDQKINHQLINASISGNTTQDALTRLPQLLTQHKVQWVLIELGGNDGLQGWPPSTTKQHLATIIEKVKQVGAKPILMQIKIPPNYGPRYVQQFEQIYPQLAKHYDIPLMPFIFEKVVFNKDFMLSDGIHPNAQAQPLLQQQAAQYLTSLLNGHKG